ncbi:protein kinase [Vibrio parahaemolyticus]|uniref:protein kinase domain-containing protein n=1 Tax=Vibrio parahaemolyticus TaxID=670 RepID=UPI0015DF6B25|nr:protein kinase [Vibrio parahaemolyticus]MCG0034484.1 protein kinase [Vibrio parahaemolyticus]MCX8946394.1 protein kinase [Vibrio parahaemolyticus]MDL2016164.1 protein kinase [Vibrio parahaemolyticus]MDL2039195.1 protein kinase [Vibrio parahaemolyticus]HCM1473144.1 protein kinase [Vibrio parahaemolyticus]
MKYPKLINGSIQIDGVTVKIPGFDLLSVLGRGANAIVFTANDELLSREVAIKVWNSKGRSRAQSETSKIAQINHELILQTYYYGTANDYPYAVMELVSGSNGKEWLKTNPEIREKINFWDQYSKALKVIYNNDLVHGDPHLGNVLIKDYAEKKSMSIKVADMGTSVFWDSKRHFDAREAKILCETASKLLCGETVSNIWSHPQITDPRATIDILGELFEFCKNFYGMHALPPNHGSMVAGHLVDLVTRTPLFDIEEIARIIKGHHIICSKRFFRRLNHKLLCTESMLESETDLTEQTIKSYDTIHKKFLSNL